MRREITAINGFSMVIAFMAGAVLCMQITNLRQVPELALPKGLLWAIEAAIFGTALCVWRPAASVIGWMIGVAVLMVTRLTLGCAAGYGLTMMEDGTDLAAAIQRTSTVAPRFAAVLFSLMVGYALRAFLPVRPTPGPRDQRRFAGSPAVKSAAGPQADGEGGLLIVTVKDRQQPVREAPRIQQKSDQSTLAPIPDVAGPIEIPLSALLAEIPREMVTEKANRIVDSERVSLPSDKVLPQLREAQVRLSIHEVVEILPSRVRKALLDPSDLNLELDSVDIPLELIVPQLPPEVFSLPPARPPEWADADVMDGVVFATT